ncbi:MAG: hypothetical protein ABI778_11410 [Ignavibacteriota bacterium]
MKTRHLVVANVLYFAFCKNYASSAKRAFGILATGIALASILSIFVSQTVLAQVPRSISYQGFLLKSNQPVNGQVNIDLKIYNAGGELLYSESVEQVNVKNGLFTILLGGNSGRLPESLKFDEQYYLGIDVDHTGETVPRTPFVAAPYALNSQTVGGVSVSVTPQPGMLLPLDKNGKLPKDVMPTSGEYLSTINGLQGDNTGGINIVSANEKTLRVTNDATNNRIVLTVMPPELAGEFTANSLSGSGPNKYSGSVPITQNVLFMTIPYSGIEATSNVVVSVNDPAGQTAQVTVGTITPGVGFNIFFSGYYPTTTGKLNYLVIN